MQILTMDISEQGSTPVKNISASQPLQKLILAESQPIIFQPLLSYLKKEGSGVILCSNYQELVDTCIQEKPDVLILGTIPEFNCLEVYRRCRNQWHHLPIILLVNQPVVNDYFKKWAIKKGISNVVSSYPQSLALLRAAVEDVIQFKEPQNNEVKTPIISVKKPVEMPIATLPQSMELGKAIAALNQLTEHSQHYFGPLVIGNYWKKARTNIIEAHPWLNQWNVDYYGKISYLSSYSIEEELSGEKFNSLYVWTQAFLLECQRIVIDFPKLLEKKHLSPEIDRLISSATSITRHF